MNHLEVYRQGVYESTLKRELEKIASEPVREAVEKNMRVRKLTPEEALKRKNAKGLGKNFLVAGKIGKKGLSMVGKRFV